MEPTDPLPDYGRRTIISMIDELALQNPDRVIYSFALTSNPEDGFRDVTTRTYANSINRAALWLEKSLGRKSDTFEPIGYIGPSDLRYQILTFAAVKAGYNILLNSPRNSIEGHLNVINISNCNIWALPSQRVGNVEQILAKKEFRIINVPELEDFLDEELVPLYPYSKTFDEARCEPFMVLHTSGSTGLPKPIVTKHAIMTLMDSLPLLPDIEGKPLVQMTWINKRIYSAFPNFHAAGVFVNCCLPVFLGATIIFSPLQRPINTSLIDSMIDYADVDGLGLPPSLVEELASTPSSLKQLEKIDFVFIGGGPISFEAGRIIGTATRLDNSIGSTEGGIYPIVQADPDCWNYFHFHPSNGFEFRPYGTDGLYEQVQVKKPGLELYQGYLITFPDQDEVQVKDLFSKHPTKHGRWLYRGRADDIIVLSNGEKFNPLDMEAALANHPAVKSALIVGQARFQTAALVELFQPEISLEERDTVMSSIWELIKEANAVAPSHARVQHGFILLASPEKPFVRAGKGTVLRRKTVDVYEKELDALYSSIKLSYNTTSLDTSTMETILQGLQQIIIDVTGFENINLNDDLFAAGVDSLAVFTILGRIQAVLAREDDLTSRSSTLRANDIYNNPTISKLSQALFEILHPKPGANESQAIEKHLKEMEAMLSNYAADLPQPTAITSPPKPEDGLSVILTGSTGSLGTYLLDNLLSLDHIKRIYCLNRAMDGKSRQTEISEARGLNTFWGDRVQFLKTDLSLPEFGLDKAIYNDLLQHTTHIIHNQWQVDFNLSLASFEPHIKGVRNLINFSGKSANRANIFFISSVGAATGKKWDAPVPECLIDDLTSGGDMGYGSSKLISELLLDQARKVSKVPSTICRVGQIAGPVKSHKGMWNKQEWLPTVISAAKFLKVIPDHLGSMNCVDWIPVDCLSQVIIELASLDTPSKFLPSSTTFPSTPVYHCVNPLERPWGEILPVVSDYLGHETRIGTLREWLETLRLSAKKGEVEMNPGIKLLDFYEGADRMFKSGRELPRLETNISREKSVTLRNMSQVTEEWMSIWMEQWGHLRQMSDLQ